MGLAAIAGAAGRSMEHRTFVVDGKTITIKQDYKPDGKVCHSGWKAWTEFICLLSGRYRDRIRCECLQFLLRPGRVRVPSSCRDVSLHRVGETVFAATIDTTGSKVHV